jgi:hypothetical protein
MKDSIIKLREQLVGLSKDPIETRKLLDQLTEEEIEDSNIRSHFHVGEKDILETKDLEYAKVHRLRNGYLLHYHGGYSVLVDEKLLTTCQALEMLKNGVPENMENQEDKEALTLANTAVETIFRLPMFVFNNEVVLYSIAEIATRYLLLLQKMGEVPTAETENPEFDKFILQINDFMENFAAGLEKEGKEYEKRMGYGKGKEESDS